MPIKKRLGGLILLSMGCGMLLVLLIPGWGFVIAGAMVVIGFCNLFLW